MRHLFPSVPTCTLPNMPRCRGPDAWRNGGITDGWPERWDRAERWPKAPRVRDPEPRVGAAIVACVVGSHFDQIADLVVWDAEAAEAAEQLYQNRCCACCRGRHILVSVDDSGHIHVRPLFTDPPAPELATELVALYPRPLYDDRPPETWPTPSQFNTPLTIPEKVRYG